MDGTISYEKGGKCGSAQVSEKFSTGHKTVTFFDHIEELMTYFQNSAESMPEAIWDNGECRLV
jgi:hypothetical protein